MDAMFRHGKSTCYDYKNFNNWFHQHQLGNTYKNFNTVMAEMPDANAPGTSGSPTASEPDEAAEATGTDSIYQLDLTTMQLQEVEVEVTEADIMAAAEQLAGAMLLGAGMFETEQQRDAALDAVQVGMLDIADTLDERYDVDRVRHEDVPAGYELSTPAVVEHDLPDDGGTGVH